MSGPLALGFAWLIAANLVAMMPSRDRHRRAALALIVPGIPLLGWITWVNGPLWGLAFLLGGASVLRWPLSRLWRGLRPLRGPAE